MKPVKILNDIHWVGALHPDLRVFDIIMDTKNGSTYNSYFIDDEKKVVIDTVKEKFTEQYLDHLASLVDLSELDYIIVQHTEMDHSGALLSLLEAAPKAKVVCSRGAVKYVQNIVNQEVDIVAVKNGELLEIGSRTLQFVVQPNVHWPDTMMTFSPKDELLFSCDVFGAHFCDGALFSEDINRDFWPEFKYYFDMIMRPFKKNVKSALDKISELPISMIAPSHGPILNDNLHKYRQAYAEWSEPKGTNDPLQVRIYTVSAHDNTDKMADAIAQGVKSTGAHVEVLNALDVDIEAHLDAIEACDVIIFGSPTINGDAVKPVWDILNSLVTIDTKGKIAGSFGSYGWSGEAQKFLDQRLSNLKFKVPYEGLQCMLTPTDADLQACQDFGVNLVNAVK